MKLASNLASKILVGPGTKEKMLLNGQTFGATTAPIQ
jgi:hypothetical protein